MFYKGGISFFLLFEVPDRIGESSGKNDGETVYLWITIYCLKLRIAKRFTSLSFYYVLSVNIIYNL